ncbi:MAG: hypothetical protein Q7T68_19255 [Sphingopyxis sp.]|nr:hypothetical protein [Sphingopyxis sp.]
MPNGPDRAAYWRDFVIARCPFPDPARLAEQFEGAEFSGFCECGCNSFDVQVRSGTAPLARKPKGGGVVFMADFAVGAAGQLEIMLSVGGTGHLDRVDVTYNANSAPVPDADLASFEPFHVWASKNLVV